MPKGLGSEFDLLKTWLFIVFQVMLNQISSIFPYLAFHLCCCELLLFIEFLGMMSLCSDSQHAFSYLTSRWQHLK
ncbi:hypothetical protein XELAEV_18015603mg [Xenopus laevis]|uniref:Uncharacterized protein n=1 Tax=Xenopus laevis TaxID=8355 RepID=A0A974DKT9_XENLA|nr:hypothetical protein XELAEV_18015603mg [Xenopus laevis]